MLSGRIVVFNPTIRFGCIALNRARPSRVSLTFNQALKTLADLTPVQRNFIIESAKVDPIQIKGSVIDAIGPRQLSPDQKHALESLKGRSFIHPWRLEEVLAEISPDWRPVPGDDARKKELDGRLAYLTNLFRAKNDEDLP